MLDSKNGNTGSRRLDLGIFVLAVILALLEVADGLKLFGPRHSLDLSKLSLAVLVALQSWRLFSERSDKL